MSIPQHIAVIMDGNGRWARERGLPRLEGHRAGATAVRRILDACLDRGIKYVTLFSFSTENWQRSEEEVSGLMRLFEDIFRNHLPDLLEKNVRLRVIGDVSRLPDSVRSSLEEDIKLTEKCEGLQIVLAMNYGAREEIVRASRNLAQRVADGELSPDAIDEKSFSSSLWTDGIPDPELLIRTSGEMRISNFLLWQIAYSEITIVPEYWPQFDEDTLDRCLEDFTKRERRFGMTSEQVQENSEPGEPILNGVQLNS